MPSLGLWVPTWNRAGFFMRLMESIEGQHAGVTVRAGVNPPSDGYRFPEWCHPIFNAENIGQSRNILQGVHLSEEDYLWMVGDDEQLLPGAIEEIQRCISTSPGMVICTDGQFNHGPTGAFESWAAWMDACMDAGREVMLTAQTLMSATVFRRAGLDREVAARYLGTRYGHHYGMLHGLIKEPVVVTSRPVFVSGKAADSSIWAEPAEYRNAHNQITSDALRDLIRFAGELTGKPYPPSCYQPGVGFDGRSE